MHRLRGQRRALDAELRLPQITFSPVFILCYSKAHNNLSIFYSFFKLAVEGLILLFWHKINHRDPGLPTVTHTMFVFWQKKCVILRFCDYGINLNIWKKLIFAIRQMPEMVKINVPFFSSVTGLTKIAFLISTISSKKNRCFFCCFQFKNDTFSKHA